MIWPGMCLRMLEAEYSFQPGVEVVEHAWPNRMARGEKAEGEAPARTWKTKAEVR